MVLALPFPDISPEIFTLQIGGFSFALRWYALAYIAGLLIGLTLIRQAIKRETLWRNAVPPMTRDQAEQLLTWIIAGVVIGGRLGFVLFYQPGYYLAHPMDILKVWEGGMAFHGGLAGVIVAAALFCKLHKLPYGSVADLLALATPTGLMLGRLANFINAELWGRPTQLPWGVVFPGERAQACPVDWVGACARHPSQLYQAGLEGLVLGAVLFALAFFSPTLKTPWRLSGVFFLGYGLARFFVEFFRQADAQFTTPDNPFGHVLQFGQAGLTMGQLLSLPMIVLGAALIVWTSRKSLQS